MESETRQVSRLKRFLNESGVRVSKVMEITGIPAGTMYGYLGGVVPRPPVRFAIQKALEQILNREIDESALFDEESK